MLSCKTRVFFGQIYIGEGGKYPLPPKINTYLLVFTCNTHTCTFGSRAMLDLEAHSICSLLFTLYCYSPLSELATLTGIKERVEELKVAAREQEKMDPAQLARMEKEVKQFSKYHQKALDAAEKVKAEVQRCVYVNTGRSSRMFGKL